MHKKTMLGIIKLIDDIVEMLRVLNQFSSTTSAIKDCLDAMSAIESQLLKEKVVPVKTKEQLRITQESFNVLHKEHESINQKSIELLKEQVVSFRELFMSEVKAKLNVLFLPYKASMWDSLASVYDAAVKDQDCEAKVVPISYYQLAQKRKTLTYEGELFPKDVPITHFSQYNLEEESPDIIFVHNIYDDYNTITQVDEKYFTSNLKNYTDMLVYIPYNVPSFIRPKKGGYSTSYSLPSVNNVDKIILAGEYLEDLAIREGIPKEKLLVLGSPKLDAMVQALDKDITYPKEWRKTIEGKKVFLLNTGCMFFINHTFDMYKVLTDLVNMTKFIDNSVLIWRPHPLTEASIQQYIPIFYEQYKLVKNAIKEGKSLSWQNVIYDDTPDYIPALKVADVLISGDGSLLRSYLLTEKSAIFIGEHMPERSLLPQDTFYYFNNREEPWFEVVKRLAKGEDPLAVRKKGLASTVYANTDGTCGEKVIKVIKRYFIID